MKIFPEAVPSFSEFIRNRRSKTDSDRGLPAPFASIAERCIIILFGSSSFREAHAQFDSLFCNFEVSQYIPSRIIASLNSLFFIWLERFSAGIDKFESRNLDSKLVELITSCHSLIRVVAHIRKTLLVASKRFPGTFQWLDRQIEREIDFSSISSPSSYFFGDGNVKSIR